LNRTGKEKKERENCSEAEECKETASPPPVELVQRAQDRREGVEKDEKAHQRGYSGGKKKGQ